MNLETELLEITSDNLSEAHFMASNYIDAKIRNRIFFNVIGSEAVISYLGRLGCNVENLSNIHSIKRVVEKIDIADIILSNIHIDVRIIFNEKEIFIPKSHYDLGIVPDIYAVLKFDNSYKRINFIGFFEPSEINLNNSNEDYYFIERKKLHSPFDMYDFISNFNGNTERNLSDGQILRGRELSVAVADHDVSDEEFKEFVGLLVKSSILRNSVLEYDNFETLAYRVAKALQVSKSKYSSGNEVVDFDDFISMPDENQHNESENQPSEEGTEAPQVEDYNGDDMLDDSTSDDVGITEGVELGAAVTGALAANVLGPQAASEEAMNLAAIAGDAAGNLAKELIDDKIQENEDIPENNVNISKEDEVMPNINEEDSDTDKNVDIVNETSEANNESLTEITDEDIFDNDLTDFPDIDISEDENIENIEDNDSSKDIDSDLLVSDNDSAETENLESNENELNFGDFEQDINPESFDNFITEELSDNAETENQTPSEDVISESLLSDIQDNTQKIVDESDKELNSFDIGDSIDSVDTEDISNQSDENADANYDIDTDADNSDNSEAGEESSKDDTHEENENSAEQNSEDNSENIQDESSSGGKEIEEATFETLDINENELIKDIEEPELMDADNPFETDAETEILLDNESVSPWDGEFTDVIETDPEAGDDDLVMPKADSDKSENDNLEKVESVSELEDISSADFGMEMPEFVPPETGRSEADKFDDTYSFEELPTEKAEIPSDENNYGLIDLSDLTDTNTAEPYNAEVNFAEVENLADFETMTPVDSNSDIDYNTEKFGMEDLINPNAVTENSVVIGDKNFVLGEIFIDINKDSSQVGISSANEHLEELYNKNSDVLSDDSGLNNEVRIGSEKEKTIPMAVGIGGIALVVVLASIIMFSVSKFMNPTQTENEPVVTDNTQNNNLGEDVPNVDVNNSGVVMNDNQTENAAPQYPSGQNAGTAEINTRQSDAEQVRQTSKPIPATSFLSVRKLSWEVPDYVSTDPTFRQYFQSAGKSLKAGLSSDLLLATDYTYSDQIRVSILFDKDGSFQRAKILLSSGSSQVDNIVLQSVNQTLKVLKAPNSLGNDQSTTVILKIYL